MPPFTGGDRLACEDAAVKIGSEEANQTREKLRMARAATRSAAPDSAEVEAASQGEAISEGLPDFKRELSGMADAIFDAASTIERPKPVQIGPNFLGPLQRERDRVQSETDEATKAMAEAGRARAVREEKAFEAMEAMAADMAASRERERWMLGCAVVATVAAVLQFAF